jgi:signal peptidase II
MTGPFFAFLVASVVLVSDRLSKAILINSLARGQSIKVIPDIFHITLIYNTGAAFGMFKGRTQVFSAISVFVIALITVYLLRTRSVERVIAASLGLILGGAVSNLIDRLWLGYVIDYFDFRVWPVFNIADSCITIGTVILAASILFRKEPNASHTR